MAKFKLGETATARWDFEKMMTREFFVGDIGGSDLYGDQDGRAVFADYLDSNVYKLEFHFLPDGGDATIIQGTITGISIDRTALSEVILAGKGEKTMAFVLEGADKIIGSAKADIINGYAGNDKLTGGDGPDTFVFAKGYDKDKITDFNAKGDKHDTIDLSDVKSISGFKDLDENHLERHGRDVWIDAGKGDVLVLEDVKMNDLDKGDFDF